MLRTSKFSISPWHSFTDKYFTEISLNFCRTTGTPVTEKEHVNLSEYCFNGSVFSEKNSLDNLQVSLTVFTAG